MITTKEDNPYHFGFRPDLTGLEFLKDALQKAVVTAPQPVRGSLSDKAPSEKLCVAIDENQMALADAKSCRYLASANTAVCRTFFLRNPKTSATVVAHLNSKAQEKVFLDAIERIAQRGEELDMYITGGAARCDYQTEMAYLRGIVEDREGTANEIEETLDNIDALAERLGIKVNIKVMNLYSAKQTMNSALDTVTGDYFYLPNEVMKPFIISPHTEKEYEKNVSGPVSKVFDGLQNKIQVS